MKTTLSTLAAAALLATIAATSQAQTTTLYSDPLTGSSSSPLNGTTPAITIGGNTWTAAPAWNADGSIASQQSYNLFAATLPFTPVAGKVYTLSADLTTYSGQHLMLGFGQMDIFQYPWQHNGSDTTINANNWGGQVNIWTCGSGDPNGMTDRGYFTKGATAKIVLDTTGGSAVTDWIATDYFGGNLLGTYTLTATDLITTVNISSEWYDDAGKVGNFTLTETVVPEPSTCVMILGGVGMLVAGQRRRRSHKI